MSNAIEIIRKRESLDFIFDLGGEDISGWTCNINVKQYPDDTSLITRTIAPDATGKQWSGYITETESATLTEGVLYWLIGVLENATTDERRTVPKRFQVSRQWGQD
jgi:hypothetical protein